MEYFIIYLWTRLSVLNLFLAVIATLSGIAWVCSTVMIIDLGIDPAKKAISKTAKYFAATFCITLAGFLLIPTKSEALMIYIIPKLYNSEGVQDAMDILNRMPAKMRKYLDLESIEAVI